MIFVSRFNRSNWPDRSIMTLAQTFRITKENIITESKKQRHGTDTKYYNQGRSYFKCEKIKNNQGWRVLRNLKKVRTYSQICPGEPFFCLCCYNTFHNNV